MPRLSEIAIVDTSCFILLDKINETDLLQQLFNEVYTTQDVVKEFGQELPEWVQIKSVRDKKYKTLLELDVDKGEAGTIALCTEMAGALLVLDDLRARKLAQRLDIMITGTLGIIARARREGVVTSVKPIIEKIKHTNFRFS